MYHKMNSVVNYTSSLTSEPFLYEETKIIVELRLQGYSNEEIREKVIKDNVWAYKSIKQATRLIPVVLRRIIFLDDNMADVLVKGNDHDSKIVVLNLVMKNNLLFSKFVNEVCLMKIELKEKNITHEDIANFFERKRKKSAVVAKWSPYVLKKLGQVYLNIIHKSGVLE